MKPVIFRHGDFCLVGKLLFYTGKNYNCVKLKEL